MNIEVYSKKDSNDYGIYDDIVDVIDSSNGESFIVYIFDTLTHEFANKDYSWKELTPDEAISYGIYSKENENLKYKLTVDDSGYGMNCTKCERIIFIQPKVGDSVEISPKQLSELDWININGIKFKRMEDEKN